MYWWQLPTCIPGIVEECLPFLDQRILSEKVSSKLKFEPENVRTGCSVQRVINQFFKCTTDGRTDEWIRYPVSIWYSVQNEAFTVRVRPVTLSPGFNYEKLCNRRWITKIRFFISNGTWCYFNLKSAFEDDFCDDFFYDFLLTSSRDDRSRWTVSYSYRKIHSTIPSNPNVAIRVGFRTCPRRLLSPSLHMMFARKAVTMYACSYQQYFLWFMCFYLLFLVKEVTALSYG